ncbi:transglutaminase-like domain-containing protein, partial [Paenibacillus sp. A51L]
MTGGKGAGKQHGAGIKQGAGKRQGTGMQQGAGERIGSRAHGAGYPPQADDRQGKSARGGTLPGLTLKAATPAAPLTGKAGHAGLPLLAAHGAGSGIPSGSQPGQPAAGGFLAPTGTGLPAAGTAAPANKPLKSTSARSHSGRPAGGSGKIAAAASGSDLSGHSLSLPLRLATSLLLLGLLAEWLLPLAQLPGWNSSFPLARLLLIGGAFLAAGAILLPGWAASLLRAAVLIGGAGWMAGGMRLLLDWIGGLPGIIADDIRSVGAQGISGLSAPTQALLLLAGLAALLSALQTLVWIRQWGLGLTVLTGLYLGLLYQWMGLDLLPGMARAAAEGLLLSALLTGHRLRRRAGEAPPPVPAGAWGFPSGGHPVRLGGWAAAAGAALLVLGAALLLSSGKPRLYGPASWALEVQHSIREGASSAAAGAGNASRLVVGSGTLQGAFSGYSQDDSVLGAPLALARTPVFTALSPASLYWRGESKSVYEGRGWREDYGQLQSVPIGSVEGSESGGSDEITQTVRLARHAEGQPLPVSGRNAELMAAQGEGAGKGATAYLKDKITEAIYLPQGGSGELQYEARSVKPETSASVLRAQSEVKDAAEGDDAGWLQEQIQANLQLPSNLPKRVKDLASSIVRAAGPNRYDQAAAVSQYLKQHYVYSLTDTSIPKEGQDLADQFLFVQKTGYCVHFSTAMAVMLRSQGIPARWVKGYTAGSPAKDQSEAEAGSRVYEVTAADAHAWVEVYLGGAGWVAFDPTPGFAGPAGAAAALQGASPQAPNGLEQPGAAQDGSPAQRLRDAAGSAAARLAASAAGFAQAAG